ncbi:STAS domain-containing protein [Sedimenticola sp.]|uniref:STAS domain-containing protein n=1 Tax=Sedimenticola sp. TaxID=1940285 RepID=UPI003D147C33
MTAPQAVIDDRGVMRLSGDLVFAHVTTLLGKIEKLLESNKGSELVIDMSQVGDVDSSGLALLLEVMEHAQRREVKLRIRSLSEALLGIARLSNVDALLPLEG